MTAIAWKARLVNLDTLAEVDSITAGEMIAPSFGSTIDNPGKLHLELRPGTTFINKVLTAWGGGNFAGDLASYFIQLSLDGGTTWATGGWLEQGTVVPDGLSPGAIIDQQDVVRGLSVSYIDEATYIDTTVDDTMRAPSGGIHINSANVISATSYLPSWWKGLFEYSPGLDAMSSFLKFTGIVNPLIAGNDVDTVVNSDSLLRSSQNVLSAVSGLYDPSHPKDFGAYQHISFDVKHMQALVGYRGLTSKFKARGDISPRNANELIEAAIVDSDTLKVNTDLTKYFAQTQVVGGSSSHGMPDGGQFTGVAVINKPTSGTSTGVFDNLIVLAVTTSGNGGGGIYTWLGDGYMRPLSQSMDVNGLAVDGTANVMYAATRIGIMSRSTAGPYTTASWARVGDATLEFTKVWVPAEGVIYAIASGSNNDSSSNGVWRYTVADGWKRAIGLTNIVDASGSDTYLYYTDTTAPSIVTVTSYPSTAAGTPLNAFGGAHIVGMDFTTDGYVVIRTELGAAGVYRAIGNTLGSITTADPTGTLADGFGPLAVASFLRYNGLINAKNVEDFAVTDRGIYWNSTPGGAFSPTDGQSGIQDVNAVLMDAGTAQTIMGRTFVLLVAITGRSLYISRDGGYHWGEELAQPVDGLVAYYEAIRRFTGQYPDGANAAFGSAGVPGTDPQGAGNIVIVPAGDPLSLPSGWIVARRWTSNGRFTCRMVNLKSRAPYNAMSLGDASTVIADDSRGVVDASSACLTFMYRVLAQADQPQSALQLTVAVSTQEAAVNQCVCGDMITVDYYKAYQNVAGTVTTVMADYDNYPMYIVDMQCRQGSENSVLWDLTLVNNTLYDILDPAKILAALANGQSATRRLAHNRIR